jgi:hypothetical protein
VCPLAQKGSIELVGEFFEVRAQVDHDLTTVSWVDRRLGLIKNRGRHSLPPLTESRPEIRLENNKMGRRTHGFEIAGSPDT